MRPLTALSAPQRAYIRAQGSYAVVLHQLSPSWRLSSGRLSSCLYRLWQVRPRYLPYLWEPHTDPKRRKAGGHWPRYSTLCEVSPASWSAHRWHAAFHRKTGGPVEPLISEDSSQIGSLDWAGRRRSARETGGFGRRAALSRQRPVSGRHWRRYFFSAWAPLGHLGRGREVSASPSAIPRTLSSNLSSLSS